MTLILFYLFLALSVSFLCSVMEAVLLSTPLSYITLKEKEGGKAATLLKKQKQNIDDPIAAILSLNTIAHTIGAAGVGAEAVRVFGEAYFGLISAILTILILVLSEIIPKSVGANYWRSLALSSARIIQGMVWVTYPLVLLSKSLTHLISSKRPTQSVSREEVSAMVTVGLEEGVFEKKENRMIQSLIKLDKQSVHNIMTPSTVVAAASVTLSLREFYANKAYSTYSRIPVYDENRDFLIGYVLRQTVLEKLSEDKFDIKLSEILRPILSFNEDASVPAVWEKMLEKKEHIAAVIDEYGCCRGIVTLEDVIETILGLEIVDEKDTVVDMQELAKEKWKESQGK